MVVSEACDFFYKVTTPYNPQAERVLWWSDSDLASDWPIQAYQEPKLSDKDKIALSFKDCDKYC